MGTKRSVDGMWFDHALGGFQETCDGIDNDGDAVLNEGRFCSECETRSCLFSSGVCVAGANHCKMDESFKDCIDENTDSAVVKPGEGP